MGENYPIAVLFLDRSGFDFYTPTQESTIRFNFPQEIFQDMEIINNDQFLLQLASFITTYNIPPSLITIIISDSLLFIKDLQISISTENESTSPQTMTAIEQQKEIKRFLETVPFETVESKTYPIETGIRVVATNKAIYDAIRISFEKEKSLVKAVIPAFIVADQNETEGLSESVISNVVNNTEAVNKESFVIHPEELLPLTQEEKQKQFLSLPKHQTKLYAIAGGFFILFAIFGVMFKQMMDSNADINAKAPTPTSAPIIAQPTTPNITPIVATNSAGVINNTKIRIQIVTSTSTTTQGQLIKNKLLEKGYSNITVAANTTTNSSRTLVIFASSVDASTQQTIATIIKDIFTTFSTQVNTQTQYDITIIPSNNP